MVLPGKPVSVFVSCCWFSLAPASFADEAFDAVRKEVQEQIETVETEALFKEAELSNKYMSALEALEKKLTAAGDLEAIMHLREEKESIKKDGRTTSHAEKPLVELREKYNGAIKVIRDDLAASREKVKTALLQKVKEQETSLTKAGKVEEAIALRKETERMLAEFSSGASSGAVAAVADPRDAAGGDQDGPKEIKVPEEKPPVNEKPFAIKGRWLENMTIPPMKQRISAWTVMGDRGGPKAWITVVVSPGSVWSGGTGGGLDLSAGKFVASKSRFEDLSIVGDLACNYYFTHCDFSNCGFNKGGVWYGWDQATKFYFDSCVIRKRFNNHMNLTDFGFRAQNCVFEGIEFPAYNFRKKEPADYLDNKWLRIVNCRFTGCQIPLSVLMLTQDCIFENCTFVPDDDKINSEPLKKPIEVVVYQNNCKNRIQKLPANVKLTLKSDNEWKGVAIPTTASLLSLIGGL